MPERKAHRNLEHELSRDEWEDERFDESVVEDERARLAHLRGEDYVSPSDHES